MNCSTTTILESNSNNELGIDIVEKWLNGSYDIDPLQLEDMFAAINQLFDHMDAVKYPLLYFFKQFLLGNKTNIIFTHILQFRPSIAFIILFSINSSKLATMYLLHHGCIRHDHKKYLTYSKLVDLEKPLFLFSHFQIHSLNPPNRTDWTINQKWMMKSITRVYGSSLINLSWNGHDGIKQHQQGEGRKRQEQINLLKVNRNIKFVNCNHVPVELNPIINDRGGDSYNEHLGMIMASTLNHLGFYPSSSRLLKLYNSYGDGSLNKPYYQAACLAIAALSGNKLEWLSNDALYDCLHKLNPHLTGSLLVGLAIAFRGNSHLRDELSELISIHLPGFKSRNIPLTCSSSLPSSSSSLNSSDQEIQITLLVQSYAALATGFLHMGSGDPNKSAALMRLFKGGRRLGNPLYPYNLEYYDCQYILMIAMTFGLLYVPHYEHTSNGYEIVTKCLTDGPMYADIKYLLQVINGEERMNGKGVAMVPAAIIALYGALAGSSHNSIDSHTNDNDNSNNIKDHGNRFRLSELKTFANKINIKEVDRPFNFILKTCCKLLLIDDNLYDIFDITKCFEIINSFCNDPNEKMWLEYSYACYCLAGIALYSAIRGNKSLDLIDWIENIRSHSQWFIYSIDWEVNKYRTPLIICHDYILLSISITINASHSLNENNNHDDHDNYTRWKLDEILKSLYQDPMDFNSYRSKMYHLSIGFLGMGTGNEGGLFKLATMKRGREHEYYLLCYLVFALLNFSPSPSPSSFEGIAEAATGTAAMGGEGHATKESSDRIILLDYLWLLCTEIKADGSMDKLVDRVYRYHCNNDNSNNSRSNKNKNKKENNNNEIMSKYEWEILTLYFEKYKRSPPSSLLLLISNLFI